ncbi:hypothetical protein RHP06_25615, partial [Salmonella enterica subsp. enterica serovar Typhimurium]|nr:hypothetical protein [Salmonella enterica subsp. enterica serovar Typhimurium]
MAILTAKELSIVWGSDARYWKWISMIEPISCKPLDVAELIEVCWLEIDGKYAADKLVGGKKYRVDFVVELKDNLVMNGPVTLKLTRPDGSSEEHKEDLEKKPKNEWIRLKVGEFRNGLECGCGTQEA